MSTSKELGLSPGSSSVYKNEAGLVIFGTIHNIDPKGNADIWVQWCNSSVPIDELFPESKHKIAADDTGFAPLPSDQ
ncbi:MAG: hypothetical protein A3H50_02225 [Candidatus Levybacteria bacterium RIFCSPLOWO2_02_FULL_37_10]|nr:MAG: hypothetical protein A2860_04650 [Candidatus Levybacteria bacterium RIFCSPHIGHO2_01_FULL_37_33]OGH29227.1 MAG: hypothetical protein A3F30_03255 [Candidatus Levybacteria bacterium RIFCSPHIGHO2_12_FULL_37_12]OGH33099.1 MAG: hypothetical protein A2953_03465 [Candidatus Levybacteria bacterium RIFCSPLOWO2_01_FULL_36_54]OGH45759.1 MAG: hypothetical protein A3H50_02225 [Candidatus Levybacteria bacterium RIFCSPLOWO2_02_FULL_37_10]